MSSAEVVISGAGPVGLVVALMCARVGIKVKLLEVNPEVIQTHRAMGYGPAGVIELERLGIAQECRELGMQYPDDYVVNVRWITLDNKKIAGFKVTTPGYPPVTCGQHLVAGVILDRLAKHSNAEVLRTGWH